MMSRRFTLYAWLTLAFTLLVIVWGDVVQATGSGDGCGAHWPTCNGEPIPTSPGLATLIEFFHRATSGISLLLTLGLLVWSRRAFPKGHLARRGAGLAMFFMVLESLVGAALVLFRWVGTDASLARAVIAPIHLVNTLFLVGSLALTAWWSSRPQPLVLRGQGSTGLALGVGLLGLVLVAASGALTSLGDALFPVHNTAEAIAQSRTPGENFLVYLRLYHPFIAIVVSLYAVVVVGLVAAVRPSQQTRRLSRLVGVLFLAQLAMGYLNVRAAAALYTQLPHLLLSDVVWISFLLFTVAALSLKPQRARTPLGEVG